MAPRTPQIRSAATPGTALRVGCHGSAPIAVKGITHRRHLISNGRVIDIEAARRWLVKQLAKDVLKQQEASHGK